jgi:hypothetical protein
VDRACHFACVGRQENHQIQALKSVRLRPAQHVVHRVFHLYRPFLPCSSLTLRYDAGAQLFDEVCELSDCIFVNSKALPDLIGRVAASFDVVLVNNPLLMREQMPLLKVDLKPLQRSIAT